MNETTDVGASTAPTTEEFTSVRDAQVVVPPADKLDLDEVRKVVGAKNVMGTCSG